MAILARAEDRNLLKAVFNFARARKVKLYIVGGYLRDTVLKRKKDNPDIDFCLKKNAISFGRLLSKKIKAGFVVLDKEHGAARLVKRIRDKIYTLDFTDFRGRTLEEDLLHRDFTINTLAAELGSNELIDMHGARKDLDARVIRTVNKKAFDEDPLRILRCFSFWAVLGFKIDKDTLKAACAKKDKLLKVSAERIREELFKVLDSPFAFSCFKEMDRLKILEIIFPEFKVMKGVSQGPYHHLDVWRHTLEALEHLEGVFSENKTNRDISIYLNEVISSGRKRRALLKFACLLHDIGKPKSRRRKAGKLTFHGHERIGLGYTDDIARYLKLSNDEAAALRRIVLNHLRPGYLADNKEISARAKFRLFRDTKNEAAGIFLLSIADQRATRGRLNSKKSRLHHEAVCQSLIKEYFAKLKEVKPERLITGDDLIRVFKLAPSPLIGKILREVEELQAIGKVKTKQDALKAAKRFIHKK